MTIVTVNENASGIWAHRVGWKLDYVRPGRNEKHVVVRSYGGADINHGRPFSLPKRWLDWPSEEAS